METGDALAILFEICLLLFLVWGFLHEDQLIDFEDRVLLRIRYKLRRNQDVIYMRTDRKYKK